MAKKPKEQKMPRVAEAVGAVVLSLNKGSQQKARRIEFAMGEAAAAAQADGITDPNEIRARMIQARDTVKAQHAREIAEATAAQQALDAAIQNAFYRLGAPSEGMADKLVDVDLGKYGHRTLRFRIEQAIDTSPDYVYDYVRDMEVEVARAETYHYWACVDTDA